jgi:hypothetical protein
MATSISADGATQYVSLRMNTGLVEYSTDQSTYTPIAATANWPVTITNTNPGVGSILRVVAIQNLTITAGYGDTSGYLIAGSEYLTFDGSGNTITLDGITDYPGFINNNNNGNIAVQNFTTTRSGGSTLAFGAAWLCQGFFGSGVSGISVTNCTNNGAVIAGLNEQCGGIVGRFFAFNGGSGTITGCTNNGTIDNSYAGGIAGFNCGRGGSVTITNCTNNGLIVTGLGIGGIVGGDAASNFGLVNITGCTNNGILSSNTGGGIAGSGLANDGGSCNITNCSNTGLNAAPGGGGIVGGSAGSNNGLCSITNCFNTGNLSQAAVGGIVGNSFAFNTNQPCSITNCYSTGSIATNNSGGIVGGNVGFNNNATYNPVVNITNCYSLGTIATNNGGICGGLTGAAYTNPATINITNSYSFGAISGTGEGLVAATLTSPNITLTTSNTYVANGTWDDTTANTNLTGDPLGVGISNKGTTWTSISANTPYLLSSYWLLTNPTQVYTPNSVSTSSANYSSVAGSYSPGIYSIQSSSQVGSTITVNVAAVAGTSPIYYGYSNNIYTLTNSTGITDPITTSINASTGVLDFILSVPYPCFLEGTQILCLENDQEVYRPVQSLRKGDLVKTIYNGFLPIHMIGTTAMYNPNNNDRIASRLYKCPKENYPGLFEDLYITGCHSILVPWLTYEQGQKTIKSLGRLFVTDKHCRLMAWVDEKAQPYKMAGVHNIYHIALENNDYYMNYGIYANGLLVESCSKRYLMEMSNMRILGEDDCSLTDGSLAEENVFHKMSCLVETC